MELAGKHILITGASQRIGWHLLRRFANYAVKLTGLTRQGSPDLQTFCSQMAQFQWCQTEWKVRQEMENAIVQAVKHFGPIDILIHNAAVFQSTTLRHGTEENWELHWRINLRLIAQLNELCKKFMDQALIIHISDTLGKSGLARYSAYCSSKAALIDLTKVLSKCWAPKIRVNCILPGLILPTNQMDLALKSRLAERSLLKRWGDPDDIFQASKFLIENDYINGAELAVDGGMYDL